MSFLKSSTMEVYLHGSPHSKKENVINAKDVDHYLSVKRTPLQTISQNSPSLLARSKASSKRRSPLYEGFIKVSQSTPIYKADQQNSTLNESEQMCATPVSHSNLPTSIVLNDVNTHCDLSEVSLTTSNFSLEQNISISEVTSSYPSLGQIEMQYESFDIPKDVTDSNFSNENCSLCNQSYFTSDNKENEYQPDYFFEDNSRDVDDDFLFHSRNSDSKIFLVPPIEDDLVIQSLDDVEVPSACQTSSSSLSICQTSGSSQFGDNEESEEAAFLDNVTTENEEAFACTLEEIQDLIEKGMFLESSTDDPRRFGDPSDGYVSVPLEGYEPEEGEVHDTEGASALQIVCEDAYDLSGESLSPGEIGSSLFSDNASFSSSSDHESSEKSSTYSNPEQDLFKSASDILQVHGVESSEDPSSSRGYFEAMYHTRDHIDYGDACDEQLPQRGELSGVYINSSSACVQDGDSYLLSDPDLLNQESSTASYVSDDNWSVRVQPDSVIYQNEVDIWNCHAIQSDLVDYFGLNDDLLKDAFNKDALRAECSMQLQDDLEELSSPPGELFESVDLENSDNDNETNENVKEPVLEIYGDRHQIKMERNSDISSETSDLDALTLNPTTGTDKSEVINSNYQTVQIDGADNSLEGGVCNSSDCDVKAGPENVLQTSPDEENRECVRSESIDDSNDDNDDDWEFVSYDEEDCIHGFHSNANTDDNSTCLEDNSTLIRDAKESQTVEALKAVQQNVKQKCEAGSQPIPSTSPQKRVHSKWKCTIL
ncbi:dentin sialophosphoprotein-like [Anneissia japonica]|uniref:dentin sialophosphoprotein-like n=1 Tax=Anneissia japonica TaxID=1529436 RepID=UPI001425AAE8|nr:dentin sialophosphoprotein-like [Anneissia japonica]